MDESLLANDFQDATTPKATPQDPMGSQARASRKRQVIACLALHGTLILLHISLLVVSSHHYEHNAVFKNNTFTTQWLPSIVTSFSQLVGAGYTAVLLSLTQKLARRTSFDRPQTLTAIHDQTTAWGGLGSAISTAYQQLQLPAAAAGVVGIAIYLGCLLALHSTIPSMLHAENFVDVVPQTVKTTLANATVLEINPDVFGILSAYNQFPTLGLLDNMVYDIIPTVASVVGNTTVNASMYSVDCMAIPESKQLGDLYVDETQQQPGGNVSQYAFQLGDQVQAAFTLPNYPAVWTSSNVTLLNSDCEPLVFECAYPIVVASILPVIDSSNSPSSSNPWTGILPQVTEPNLGYASGQPWGLMPSVQLLACNVLVTDTHIDVSGQTRLPVSFPSPPTTAQWKNWTWSPQDTNVSDQRTAVASTVSWLSTLSAIDTSSYDGGAPTVYILNGGNVTNTTSPPFLVDAAPADDDKSMEALFAELVKVTSDQQRVSVPVTTFDEFLSEDLELIKDQQQRENITLAELNLSLGRALAAVYWYGRTYNYSDVHNAKVLRGGLTNISADSQTGYGEATVNVSQLRTRLNLALPPILAGLAASTALFVMSFILIRAPHVWRDADAPCDVAQEGTGILNITWLFGLQSLETVVVPTNKDLRQAGMYRVHLGELARERARLAVDRSTSHLSVGDKDATAL